MGGSSLAAEHNRGARSAPARPPLGFSAGRRWPALLAPTNFDDIEQYRLAWGKVGAIICAGLVLGGVVLDALVYPAHRLEFAVLRFLAAVLLLAAFWALRTARFAHRVELLTLGWLAIPQVLISYMIYRTNGAESVYFAGLLLALIPIGTMFPVRPHDCVLFAGFTFGVYSLACFLQGGLFQSFNLFGAQCVFMGFTASISLVCAYLSEAARQRVFEVKRQIENRNEELREANCALAEVKGHMIEQEKMAALGTLSAGLLHEVNNPVNYSLMALKMALAEPVARGHPLLLESLTDAQDGMNRVQRIVSDLKTFAYQRPGADNDRAFPLERALRSALRLAAFELKDIELTVEVPADSEVRGDEPALIGVFINLLSNAAHALRSAGRAAPRIDVRARLEGERLTVTVRDNGVGIAPENLSRVFEPFFTTRDVGQGLGLGLAVSFAIVQRHGSRLRVASEAGAWTEFSFDLPRATAQPAA